MTRKHKCAHVVHVPDIAEDVCGISVCHAHSLDQCCPTCEHYSGPSRGLGDQLKKVTDKAGIKPCGGCMQRRAALNRLTGSLMRKKESTQ